MTERIKPWHKRCEAFDNGHIVTNSDIKRMMQEEIDELQSDNFKLAAAVNDIALKDRIERLEAALQKIIDDAESDDGATAWDGADIARAALKEGEP